MEALDIQMGERGFTWHTLHYRRCVGPTVEIVSLLVWELAAAKRIEISVGLGIRYDEVETIVEKADKAHKINAGPGSVTIGAELGKANGIEQIWWKLETEEDIVSVAEHVAQAIDTKAVPYFEANGTLEQIHSRFSQEKEGDWHQTFAGKACRWPAVLSLLGQKTEAAQQIMIQDELLQTKNDPIAKYYPEYILNVCQLLELKNPLEGPTHKT